MSYFNKNSNKIKINYCCNFRQFKEQQRIARQDGVGGITYRDHKQSDPGPSSLSSVSSSTSSTSRMSQFSSNQTTKPLQGKHHQGNALNIPKNIGTGRSATKRLYYAYS